MLDLRSIDRIVCSAEFGILFEKSDKEKVRSFVETLNTRGLQDYLKDLADTGEKTLTELRAEASQLKIPKCSRMEREQLLQEIQRYEQRKSNPSV